MDFGLEGSATLIAQSTTDYLVQFSPVILLIAGIVLAFAIIERFIDSFFGRDNIKDTDKDY